MPYSLSVRIFCTAVVLAAFLMMSGLVLGFFLGGLFNGKPWTTAIVLFSYAGVVRFLYEILRDLWRGTGE